MRDRMPPITVGGTPIADLAARLRSPFVGERDGARAALRDMGPEAVAELLAHCEEAEGRRRRRRRIYFGLMWAFFATAGPATAWCVYHMVTGSGPEAGFYGGMLGPILGGGGGGILGGFAFLLGPVPMQSQLAEVIANLDDVRAVPPLLAELGASRFMPDTRVAVGRALIHLLPRLGPDDAALLTAEHRDRLRELLGPVHVEKETDLVIAALLALEQVGDSRDIPAVEQLAHATGDHPSQSRAAEAAERCLQALQDRAERARLAASLVRPAAALPGGEALLRPAQGAAPADEAVLLRPSTPDG